MPAEIPASLSQRRNSALQSLFMTTSSLSSTLNSARGGPTNGANHLQQSPQLGGLNLESTQELKAFATVDLAKINIDRQNQLKLALEDNLKEKEKELEEATINYRSQREEYDRISKKYSQKNGELE